MLLCEDPELAAVIPEPRRAQAIAQCAAIELRISERRWSGETLACLDGNGIGLLVIEGLLASRVSVDRSAGAELLGAGDLIGCQGRDSGEAMLPLRHGGSVLVPLRIAVLDAAFVQRELTRYPELGAALVRRAASRSENLAVNLALVGETRVEDRLHLLLWHLAGRWGRVRSDGVVVPFHLTHSLLAELVAARRPTVTSGLAQLTARGLLRHSPEGLVLSGRPPLDEGDLTAQTDNVHPLRAARAVSTEGGPGGVERLRPQDPCSARRV
jgi:CRP-like cAMP-binding protein